MSKINLFRRDSSYFSFLYTSLHKHTHINNININNIRILKTGISTNTYSVANCAFVCATYNMKSTDLLFKLIVFQVDDG